MFVPLFGCVRDALSQPKPLFQGIVGLVVRLSSFSLNVLWEIWITSCKNSATVFHKVGPQSRLFSLRNVGPVPCFGGFLLRSYSPNFILAMPPLLSNH